MIDILDQKGRRLGFSRPRSEVHEKGFWHRTVHIWAFDEAGRVLFQLRSYQKENHPGLLDTSCAGHISAGQTSLEAAVRELREELSVTKRAEELEYLFEAGHTSVLNGGTYHDNEFYDTYKITLTAAEVAGLKPQQGEVEGFVWFTPHEFVDEYFTRPEKFVSHPKDYDWLHSLA